MRVESLVPDGAPQRVFSPALPTVHDVAAPDGTASARGGGPAHAFAALVDAAGALLGRADAAEGNFAAHRGGLQEMVVERARADIALQVAATAAQRGAQSLQTLLGMQI